MKARYIGAGLLPLLLTGNGVPRELIVSRDGLVRVSINGRAAVLRIDPAAPTMPLIKRKLAASAGFKMKGKSDADYLVGKTHVLVRSQVAKLDLSSSIAKRRVGWTDPPFSDVADGSIGPGAFPEPVVRFQLHAPMADEITVALSMERTSLWSGAANDVSAIFAIVEVGGKPMRVCFDPYHEKTLVTAGAGIRLARLHYGSVSGKIVPTEIFFGVRRPVRTLTLRQPFQLGTLAIRTLGVRTTDRGDVAGLPNTDTAEGPGEPDDIVVIGRALKRDVRRDTLFIGSDYLSRCSSIVFDRKARSIELTCA